MKIPSGVGATIYNKLLGNYVVRLGCGLWYDGTTHVYHDDMQRWYNESPSKWEIVNEGYISKMPEPTEFGAKVSVAGQVYIRWRLVNDGEPEPWIDTHTGHTLSWDALTKKGKVDRYENP